MTQYKDIPQPGDQRNVSQADILHNFEYLLNVANPSTIVGILPVDHQATGDNTLSPSDGFHKQVSLINRIAPTTLVNSVSGASSNGIIYSKLSNSQTQLQFYTKDSATPIDYPLNSIRGCVLFKSSDGSIQGSSFFLSVVRNSAGEYTISFAQNLPNVNYQVYVGIADNAVGATRLIYGTKVYNKLVGSFQLTTYGVTNVPGDLGLISVQVVSIF